MNLAQALGYSPGERLLIVNADDYGMCHSANAGIQQLLAEGAISSTTIMMPCPWAKEAAEWAAARPNVDVGIHLTFTSEWDTYRWGPVTRRQTVLSLITEEGYFPRDCRTVETKARAAEIYAEMTGQIRLARRMGLTPTHLDNHMGSLYGLETGRDFISLVLSICAGNGFPFRLPRHIPASLPLPSAARRIHKARVREADSLGVVIPDYLIQLPFSLRPGETYESFRESMAAALCSLQSGVSELYIHPAVITDELMAIHHEWLKRGMELQIFRDPWIREVMRSQRIRQISWRSLQQLQLRRRRRDP
ncbi:polysaccharide deacetylase family protein [Paenibacillus sp. XY044]|uniref:polysaccharide deacetylase family protein n=1 Tax=Paenibacillus sp. XY044 TaxID=2026089 RepID=UPI000B9831C9|nr:polysaccharide deacetylase family protein [Paenibacillus sp. XY044]OZB90811.1 hypothetical protein CJP46_30800 [Paenibacillus sp. XY044]